MQVITSVMKNLTLPFAAFFAGASDSLDWANVDVMAYLDVRCAGWQRDLFRDLVVMTALPLAIITTLFGYLFLVAKRRLPPGTPVVLWAPS